MTPEERQLLEMTGLGESALPQSPSHDPWSADAMFLLRLAKEVTSAKPDLIVDIGSGYTTLIAAAACRVLQHGRVVAVEEGSEYVARTEQQLEINGVEEWARVCLAPLETIEIDSTDYRWYSRALVESAIGDDPIDVLIIDGPRGTVCQDARYPVGRVLFPRLSAGAVVLVDDARREDEQRMLKRFESEHPDLSQEAFTTGKPEGGVILRKRGRCDNHGAKTSR